MLRACVCVLATFAIVLILLIPTRDALSSAAGNAFCEAAKLHLHLQSKHDAATNFVDAGNAFKKADPQGNFYPIFNLQVFVRNAKQDKFSAN